MKRIVFCLIVSLSLGNKAVSQYSTGIINLPPSSPPSGTTPTVRIDVSSTLVNLTVTGPFDRWFGLAFSTAPISNMNAGDLVAYDGTNLTDRSLSGTGGGGYNADANQDWTITSNTTAGTIRTLVATRALNTGEAGDFVFATAPTPIFIAWVRNSSASFSFGSHGGLANSARATQPYGITLGTQDFELSKFKLYPNPVSSKLFIELPVTIQSADVEIFDYLGRNVLKTIVSNIDNSVNVSSLSKGNYIIKLNVTDGKASKILIIN